MHSTHLRRTQYALPFSASGQSLSFRHGASRGSEPQDESMSAKKIIALVTTSLS
jgi:hypothetical protein